MRQLRLNPFLDSVCLEHGVIGGFPCPWPNCERGISEPQFQEPSPLQGEPSTIYSRREWPSPLGGVYYSWDSDRLPNWFSCTQTFWNESRRHKLIRDAKADVVYHYTSLDGLIGIVDNRAIWLSDYSYLNDKRELSYGTDLATEVIQSILDTEPDEHVRGLLSAWEDNLSRWQNRVCIASFSFDDDSLSQWRAYGPVAIGFPMQALALHVNQSRLQQVEYERDTQRKLLEVYLHHLCSAFSVDTAAGRIERIPDAYHGAERLLELLVFFKEPAFRSENEVRLAFVDNPQLFDSFKLPRLEKSFRVSRGRIVPYVASVDVLPSRHREFKLEISEVVLGPESDELLKRGIREFLDANGWDNVTVRRSAVPLRT